MNDKIAPTAVRFLECDPVSRVISERFSAAWRRPKGNKMNPNMYRSKYSYWKTSLQSIISYLIFVVLYPWRDRFTDPP